MDDQQMRDEWKAAGGSIHGPNVETVRMPESDYFKFRKSIANQVELVNQQLLDALKAWQHYKNADATYAEIQHNYAVASALTDSAIVAAQAAKGQS